MTKLFAAADEYLAEARWQDIALLKFCLLALGLLFGMALPQKARKPAGLAALAVFTATYLPLMIKFFPILRRHLAGYGDENV